MESLNRVQGGAGNLRIIITVDPEIPVPPTHYGGIERIVDMLVRGLEARGHRVYLFAHPESRAGARLLPYAGRRSQSVIDTFFNTMQVWREWRRLEKIDLIHSFGRLAYLLPALPMQIPKIQSYQRSVTSRSVRVGNLLSKGTLTFTACSEACAQTGSGSGGRWQVIHNGVPLHVFDFESEVDTDAPLLFLGRVERIKGAHTAVEVAKTTGRRLIIAGNKASDGPEKEYFEREIAPRCDGEQIRYVGPVTDEQKNKLLGQAAALMFPVAWEEPFGIVMAEALACGTPVIAFRRGAVPEVIDDGRTGYVCDTFDEMKEAIRKIVHVDRSLCRKVAETRFSSTVIVSQYENLYRQLLHQ